MQFHASRNLRLLYLFAFVREFTPMLVVWVLYLTEFRHLTLTQVAVMEGLFWTVKVALEVPSGAFADHFGRRATFITGTAMEAAGVFVFAFAAGFPVLIVSYVIWSAGMAFRSGNSDAYLFETLKSAGRESEYTDRIGRLGAVGMVSLVAGGLLGGLLADVMTLQVAVLASVLPFVVALPIAFALEEPPWREEHEGPALTVWATLRTGLREAWRRTHVRNIILLEVAMTATFPAFVLLSQPYLRGHGVPVAALGFLLLPVQLMMAAGSMVSGAVLRRFGLAATLAGGVVCAAAGLALVAAVDHVAAYVGVALAMGSVGVMMPAIGTFLNERTESRVRATVLSVAPMGTSLMMAMVSMFAGAIAAESMRLAFGLLAAVLGLGAGAALLAFLGARPLREGGVVGGGAVAAGDGSGSG